MPTCKYVTALMGACGRDAFAMVGWTRADDTAGEMPVCPFHTDLTLADLFTDDMVTGWSVRKVADGSTIAEAPAAAQ